MLSCAHMMLIYIGKHEGLSVWPEDYNEITVSTEYTPLNIPHLSSMTKPRIGTVSGMRRHGENVYFVGAISLAVKDVVIDGLLTSHRNLVKVHTNTLFPSGPGCNYRVIVRLAFLISQPNTCELMSPFYIVHTVAIPEDSDIPSRTRAILDEYIQTLVCSDSLSRVL